MEGKIFGNRYELIERVGTGGMAVVYKAKDKILNRFVAVKVLREEYKENEEFIRRFNIESQAAAILSHQNIVQIYDVGKEDELHYIVMEYLEGTTLKKYISQKGGKLSWREAANFSMQICRALDHAHSKHVVHRDIKPQNIMITEGGKLKVADFGIARAANNSTTVQLSTNAVGSAHYLSPEQARGGYTDRRSDIYSFGIVMYEMFTGKLPFDADNGVSVIMQHIHEEAEEPCAVNPDLPLGINAIINKAIKKEQRLRYDNAADILEDLIAVYQNPSVKPSELRASEEEGTQMQVEQKKLRDAKRHSEERNRQKKKRKQRNVLLTVILSALCVSVIGIVFILAVYNLFTNTGQEVVIPDLTGLTYEEAAREASKASTDDVVFDVIVERSDYSEEKKDTIISQMPEGKSTVKRSREIKVVISLGPVLVTLEDYSGKDYSKVASELKKLGIKVKREEEDDSAEKEGTIVRQVPDAGTELGEGEEITFYVSAGEKNTVVPSVIGKTPDEAIILIERNNLEVGKIYEEASQEYEKGQIFRQSPGAYETVPEKTVINLYVSKGEKAEGTDNGDENPSDTEATGEKLKKKKVPLTLGNLPSGRDKVNIRLVLDGQTYYEKDFPTQKGTVTITLETTQTLSLDVYYDGVYTMTKEVKY